MKLSLNLTAKGTVQFDITSEFPTVDEAASNLDKALDMVKNIVATKGYKLAGE